MGYGSRVVRTGVGGSTREGLAEVAGGDCGGWNFLLAWVDVSAASSASGSARPGWRSAARPPDHDVDPSEQWAIDLGKADAFVDYPRRAGGCGRCGRGDLFHGRREILGVPYGGGER